MVEGFCNSLDSNLDLFVVNNGVIDFSLSDRGTFRVATPEDRIQKSASFSYSPTDSSSFARELTEFLEQVLPVAVERRILLGYVGSLLSGRREIKKFIALTDHRSGNTGKSAFINLLLTIFGDFGKSKTRFVIRGTMEKDKDGHDAGLQAMRGIRLIVAEELKSSMTLDDALLKQLTGGDVRVEGRSFGLGTDFSFTWSSGFILVFNEDDMPKHDGSDGAFANRIIVVPFRSSFKDVPTDTDEEFTFKVNYGISSRFHLWRSAFLDVLLDYRRDVPEADFNVLPDSMAEWRSEIMDSSNRFASFFLAHVKVTGIRTDWIKISDLKDRSSRSKNDSKFIMYAKAYFSPFPSVKFVEQTTSVCVDGAWKSKRGVITGVVFVPLDDMMIEPDSFS
jgi:phage/plasmid-associated DNA primase